MKKMLMMKRHKTNSIVGLFMKQFAYKSEWDKIELRDEVSRYILPEQAFRAADHRLNSDFGMDRKVQSGKRTLMNSAMKHMEKAHLVEIKDDKVFRTVKMINSAPELFIDLIPEGRLKEFAKHIALGIESGDTKMVTVSRHSLREIYIFEGIIPKEEA